MKQPTYMISLCDLTGHMADPWAEAGYTTILVDPQHTSDTLGKHLCVSGVILDALPLIATLLLTGRIAFVAGFPPCTDVAVSGARWWKEKAEANPYFQAEAAIVAEQCRMVGVLSGAPWFFENPVSAFSTIFGAPSFKFDPYRFTALCPDDNYTKLTCLWAGNGFRMPEPEQDPTLGPPDNRIFLAPPGPDRANFRSATPKGFARAVFEANRNLAWERD